MSIGRYVVMVTSSTHYFRGASLLVGEIELGVEYSLDDRLNSKVLFRDYMAIAESTESFRRDVRK